MIVVDTNVIAYLLIMGDKTDLAQRTYRNEPGWVVPSLWRHEFLNVLATFVQHGGGGLEDAIGIWSQSLRLFARNEREFDLTQALLLASQHGISAYDAQYVALAIDLQAPFVTEDRRLLRLFPELAVSMNSFDPGLD